MATPPAVFFDTPAVASATVPDTAPRELGFWSALALVIGSMVGSGVFLLPASLAAFRGLSLVGWAISAAGSVALSLVFAGATLAQDKPAAKAETPKAEATKVEEKKEEAKPAPTPNKGDVAWLLTCTALVLLMSVPALALFYGGMVRAKNMLSVLMQVFATFSLLAILWAVYGYSVAFTEGNAFFGSLDKMFLRGITTESAAATWSTPR